MGKKISQMGVAPATTDGEEYFEVVQGGVSYRIQLKNMGCFDNVTVAANWASMGGGQVMGAHIASGTLVMGAYPPSHFYWYNTYANNSYLTMDKATADNDASLVFTEAGRGRWEFGATTQPMGDPARLHLKRILTPTADQADDEFHDVFTVEYPSGDMWVNRGYRFWVGALPTVDDIMFAVTELFDAPDRRVTAKIENWNAIPSTTDPAAGSQSSCMIYAGVGTSWVIGNDLGMNGNHNFFIQDGNAASESFRLYCDTYGVAINGSYLNPTEAFRISWKAGTPQGFLGPRMTTAERDTMGGKESGLQIWNSDLLCQQFWVASEDQWHSSVTRGYVHGMQAVLEESIVWWGDSLTAGSGGVPPTTAFDDLVGPGSSFNKGVGGETSTQIKDRFLAASPSTLEGIQIIWAGRNNYGSPTTVKADIAAMIAAMSHPRFLVLGIINEDTAVEHNTGGNYSTITTLNSDLAALYGRKFIDIRSILIDHGLDIAGLTPTAADTTDIGLDVVPESLRSDTLHLNTAGYAVVAQVVKGRLARAGDDLATGGEIVGDLDISGSLVVSGSTTTGAGSNTTSTNPAYQWRTETAARRWRLQYQATDATDGAFNFQKWNGSWVTKMGIDTNDMLNLEAGLKINGGGVFSQGAMYKDASLGLVMAPIDGTLYDWSLTDTAGANAISMASGTKKLTTWDDFTVGAGGTGAALVKALVGNQVAGSPQYTFVGNETTGMRRASSNVLCFDTAGTERIRISSTAMNSSVPITENGSQVYHEGNTTLAHGTYTPTLTNVANVASSSVYACAYQRVGNTVTVSGRVDFDPSAAGAVTRIGLTLPIASNLTTEYQLAGTAVSPTSTDNACAAILGDIVNDRAQIEFVGPVADVANRKWFFTFQYRVN